ALPPGPPWQSSRPKVLPWLCRMHSIIERSLRQFGVELAGATCDRKPQQANALCFHHVTAGDLLAGDVKVVGSAQRKQRGALLQHGAILLGASPFTPSLPGIRELTGQLVAVPTLQDAIVAAWQAETGWQPVLQDWSIKER